MNLYKLNTKNKFINLHSRFYILLIHNQRKKTKKTDIRISIRLHPYWKERSSSCVANYYQVTSDIILVRVAWPGRAAAADSIPL
jgi:hypothetical protein